MKYVQEREDTFAQNQLELKERLTKIESRESRLSGLVDRENHLAEHERLVEMRDREMNNRNDQLHEEEASLKKLEATSKAQIMELDDRYHSANLIRSSLFKCLEGIGSF